MRRRSPSHRRGQILGRAARGLALASTLMLVSGCAPSYADADPYVAFATIDGRSVALISYAPTGGDRVAAVDLESGDTVWEVGSGFSSHVVAAGERFVYVSYRDGFRILDLQTGQTIAEDADIEGIDAPFTWHGSDIAYDVEQRTVVLTLDVETDAMAPPSASARAIGIDDTEARPLSPELGERWECYLSSNAGTAAGFGTIDPTPIATVGGDEFVLAAAPDLPPATPTKRVRLGETLLGDTSYYEARGITPGFLEDSEAGRIMPGLCDERERGDVNETLADGLGLLFVFASRSPNDRDGALSIVDASTGEVISQFDADGIVTSRTTPDGGALIMLDRPGSDRLVLVSPDGEVRERGFSSGWLG